MKTREQILEDLKSAEQEEGRTGLVDEYLASHPETKEPKKKTKKKDED